MSASAEVRVAITEASRITKSAKGARVVNSVTTRFRIVDGLTQRSLKHRNLTERSVSDFRHSTVATLKITICEPGPVGEVAGTLSRSWETFADSLPAGQAFLLAP
jgi:hypothetical protein